MKVTLDVCRCGHSRELHRRSAYRSGSIVEVWSPCLALECGCTFYQPEVVGEVEPDDGPYVIGICLVSSVTFIFGFVLGAWVF